MANPFTKPVLNWSTPPALVLQVLPADEALVIVTNDPLCSMIFTNKNPTALALNQTWLFSGSPDNAVFIVGPGQTPPLATDLFCSIPVGQAFHGPRLYSRMFKGNYYMWCDAPSAGTQAGNNITVATGNIPMAAGDAVDITVYRLNEYNELQVASVKVVGAQLANTIIFTQLISPADYYRVVVVGGQVNTTALLNFSISNAATCEILVHLALPDLSERQLSQVQAVRVLGASSHLMNLVSDQNATGSWVGDQPEGSECWTQYLRGVAGANAFQKIATQAGNEVMELKKYNPYTYVQPEDGDDLMFQHPFAINAASGVTNTINQAMTAYHYTIVYLKSGGTTITADLSRNIQMEFYFAVEYMSDGLWPSQGASPATQDEWDAAYKIIASMENITHNPAFKEIMATIGKYVRLSAPILAMLGPYGKAASIAATGIGEGIGLVYPSKSRTKKTARPEEEQEGHSKRVRAIPFAEEV